MKRLCVALCGLAAAVSSAAAADPTVAAPPEAWSVTFASEARYYSWAGNRGYPTTVNTAPGSGSEVYVPFALQLAGKPAEDFKVQFLVRGGWVRAHQGTPGMTGTVDTATDTVTSGTVTYLGINGVQPFAALNLNLPSGRSALFGSAAFARMIPTWSRSRPSARDSILARRLDSICRSPPRSFSRQVSATPGAAHSIA